MLQHYLNGGGGAAQTELRDINPEGLVDCWVNVQIIRPRHSFGWQEADLRGCVAMRRSESWVHTLAVRAEVAGTVSKWVGGGQVGG